MSRYETKLGIPRRDYERQPLEMVRGIDSLTIRNPGSGAAVILPKDASASEIRAARKKLRPDEDADSIYNQPAKDVLDRCANGGKPVEKPDVVLVPITPGRRRDAALAKVAEIEQAKLDERRRSMELADRKAIIDGFRDALAAERAVAETPAPAADDPNDYWSWENAVKRAEAAKPEGGEYGT